MDSVSDSGPEKLTDVMFFGAGAGICFVLALFCVMTPFFLASDIVSSLLLGGFFAACYGTYYFAHQGYKVERSVRETHEQALEELAGRQLFRNG